MSRDVLYMHFLQNCVLKSEPQGAMLGGDQAVGWNFLHGGMCPHRRDPREQCPLSVIGGNHAKSASAVLTRVPLCWQPHPILQQPELCDIAVRSFRYPVWFFFVLFYCSNPSRLRQNMRVLFDGNLHEG